MCKDDLCSYGIRYATGQNSSGYLGRDRFTFELDNGATDSVDRIVFGCGTKQEEIKFETIPNQINGILGKGTGARSVVNQLGNHAQGRFSYCVPHRNDIHDKIYLKFGQEARFLQGQKVHTAPLVRAVVETYYVRLLDISVAGTRLLFPPGYFDIRHDGTGGCIIDSGSPSTALPQEAYIRVRTAVVRYFEKRQLPTKQKPGFDLCFQLPRADVPIPVIRFHFQNNADLVLGLGAFLRMGDAICLAFKSSGDLGRVSVIVGSFAQSDYRFLFNLATRTMSFAKELDCKTNS
ncbi:Aspartyl protease family protein [Thalictrum thalictroides]|uniref:Aspartyl protease family protein n=1 Tax=Thalictrum thalictroides TaxID=46969 RepID=A0A7J6XCZ5_THATH|nr:Aspartyl protease family protein [Thalictrum thalictroides]